MAKPDKEHVEFKHEHEPKHQLSLEERFEELRTEVAFIREQLQNHRHGRDGAAEINPPPPGPLTPPPPAASEK